MEWTGFQWKEGKRSYKRNGWKLSRERSESDREKDGDTRETCEEER